MEWKKNYILYCMFLFLIIISIPQGTSYLIDYNEEGTYAVYGASVFGGVIVEIVEQDEYFPCTWDAVGRNVICKSDEINWDDLKVDKEDVEKALTDTTYKSSLLSTYNSTSKSKTIPSSVKDVLSYTEYSTLISDGVPLEDKREYNISFYDEKGIETDNGSEAYSMEYEYYSEYWTDFDRDFYYYPDITQEGLINIGLGTTTINITNFRNGTCNHCNIDKIYGVRLDNLIATIDNTELIARYNFTSNSQDSSGNGLNGNIFGATKRWDSYYFDGDDDRIQLNYPELEFDSTDFSISVWVYQEDDSESSARIIDFTSATGQPTNGYRLYFATAAKKWVFQLDNGLLGIPSVCSVATENNRWYHLVGLYNGTTQKIYQNGELCREDFLGAGLISPNYAGASHDIGSRNGNAAFNGYIDEVIFWNRTLSEDEILGLYTQGYYYNATNNDANYSSENYTKTEVLWSTIIYTNESMNQRDNISLAYRTGNKTSNSWESWSLQYYQNTISGIESANPDIQFRVFFNTPSGTNNGTSTLTEVNLSSHTPYIPTSEDVVANVTLSIDNAMSWLPIAGFILGLAFLLFFLVTFVTTNNINWEYTKKFYVKFIIIFVFVVIILSGGVWIISNFLL